MKPKLDYKSLFVGLALGLVMAAALGAGVGHEPQSERYQMATNEGHAFVLDTVTGQVWEKFEPAGQSTSDDPDFNGRKNGRGR